jgi:hypothetical protein
MRRGDRRPLGIVLFLLLLAGLVWVILSTLDQGAKP